MQPASTVRRPRGPFPVPARALMLGAGTASIALGAINLFHERHVAEVDNLYVGVATFVGLVFVISLLFGYRGVKAGIALTAAIAFTEFGIISSSHFVTGPAGMSAFVKSEGITAAPVLMTLMVTCLLTFVTAIVSWSHPTGRLKRVRMLPFLLSSAVGAILVILYATDSVQRDDFGTASIEDGTFAAVVSATFWLLGGLFIGRVRKTGALLIGLGTFMATFSFTALHLAKGTHSIAEIAARSGPAWAVVATAMAGLAYICLACSLTLLLVTLLLRRRSAERPAVAAPVRRSGSA
jgi:hypothetical protein